MSLLIICPAAPLDDNTSSFEDAASLLMALTPDPEIGPGYARTFSSANWQDSDGNGYAVASFVGDHAAALPVSVASIDDLTRPDWDTGRIINMAGAARARAAHIIWGGTGAAPQARPGKIIFARAAGNPFNVLAAMGLTKVEVDV